MGAGHVVPVRHDESSQLGLEDGGFEVWLHGHHSAASSEDAVAAATRTRGLRLDNVNVVFLRAETAAARARRNSGSRH